jgi:hypothetical protein
MTKIIPLALLTLGVLTSAASTQSLTDNGGAQAQIRGYVSADTLRKWCQRQPAGAARITLQAFWTL